MIGTGMGVSWVQPVLGTGGGGGGAFTPSFNFSDGRNSQYYFFPILFRW